tara:strand:- start:1658 stop:2158 length:501 start_codon:yes stop_codon:yes gene_type:complete
MKVNFVLIKIYLTLIFSTLSSSNLSSQNLIHHFSTPPFEVKVAEMVLEKYICDTNVTILLNGNEILAPTIRGIAYQYTENLYQISISAHVRNKQSRVWTLFHEMGHVIDMVNGDLCQNPKYWLGERITEYIPYDDRPWEKSAEDWAAILWMDIIGEIIEETSGQDN